MRRAASMSAIRARKTASAPSSSCQALPGSAGMPPAASVSRASGSLSAPEPTSPPAPGLGGRRASAGTARGSARRARPAASQPQLAEQQVDHRPGEREDQDDREPGQRDPDRRRRMITRTENPTRIEEVGRVDGPGDPAGMVIHAVLGRVSATIGTAMVTQLATGQVRSGVGAAASAALTDCQGGTPLGTARLAPCSSQDEGGGDAMYARAERNSWPTAGRVSGPALLDEQHLLIRRQRPEVGGDDAFELVAGGADGGHGGDDRRRGSTWRGPGCRPRRGGRRPLRACRWPSGGPRSSAVSSVSRALLGRTAGLGRRRPSGSAIDWATSAWYRMAAGQDLPGGDLERSGRPRW